MADTVTTNLLDRDGRTTSLCDLPAEMLQTILSYCGLLPLMRLSTTCSALRFHVHEVFTSRISAQAAKYPEVRQSLDTLGWRKKHNFWACKCFKMMGGPVFSWSQIEEQRNFSVVCNSNLFKTSTTAAGKSFFMTSDREISYGQVGPGVSGGSGGHNSLRTLVNFYNFVTNVTLVSFDNVVAIFVKMWGPHRIVNVYVYNASTLEKKGEINIGHDEDGVFLTNKAITLTRDTLVVGLDCSIAGQGLTTKIQIWKINTKDPQEEDIELLHTLSHRNAQLSKVIRINKFCVNNSFIVILDAEVKVFGRGEENPLVSQIDMDNNNKHLENMVIQEGHGDHLALVTKYLSADQVPKLNVSIYSVSRGELIIQKEFNLMNPAMWWCPSPFYIKWFGDHLIISSQEENTLFLFTWQPGLQSFLNCPFGVPVVRRSSRGNHGGHRFKWVANCLKVDFQGVTTAFRLYNRRPGQVTYFKTWKSFP